ncbi:hypothetical protein THAOC_20738, partial [Thalassiosira oceanica]
RRADEVRPPGPRGGLRGTRLVPVPGLGRRGEDASSTAGGAGASSAAVARSGTSWAPSDEIGSGGVARFQQLLWGGEGPAAPSTSGDSAGGSSAGGPGSGEGARPPRRP